MDGRLFRSLDYDNVHLLGGGADGHVIEVRRGVDIVQINFIANDVEIFFEKFTYKRLAETNIFAIRENE